LQIFYAERTVQPPSGGCVLKLFNGAAVYVKSSAAAFGRLCVETPGDGASPSCAIAAAFGRLCVETRNL